MFANFIMSLEADHLMWMENARYSVKYEHYETIILEAFIMKHGVCKGGGT